MLSRCALTTERVQDPIYTEIEKILSDPVILAEIPKKEAKLRIAASEAILLVIKPHRALGHPG